MNELNIKWNFHYISAKKYIYRFIKKIQIHYVYKYMYSIRIYLPFFHVGKMDFCLHTV